MLGRGKPHPCAFPRAGSEKAKKNSPHRCQVCIGHVSTVVGRNEAPAEKETMKNFKGGNLK